jgi:hypothetical protein
MRFAAQWRALVFLVIGGAMLTLAPGGAQSLTAQVAGKVPLFPVADNLLNGTPERARVDRRVTVQPGLNLREVLEQPGPIDQSASEHLPHVALVLRVPALDLRQRLCVQVEMTECQTRFLGDERASVLPPLPDRNEIVRRGELDVDLEPLLDCRDRTEYTIEVRHHLHVHIDGALTPAVQDRGRSSGQVDVRPPIRLTAQRFHEVLNAGGVG